MRGFWPLLTALLCAGASASAQVTVDLHALDALPGAKSAAPEPAQRPAAPRALPRRHSSAKPQKPPAEQATATTPAGPLQTTRGAAGAPGPVASQPVQGAPPPATVPSAPPPVVALAPVAPPPPTAQPAPPAPPPISDTAVSAATANAAGLRVTFGSGQADLSPASAAAIQSLVKAAPSGDSTSFNVVAYAAGTPDDPSTARRLSLSRALAVRSALMADGVSSAHIYVRALGATNGDKTPDRVDLAVLGGNGPAQASTGGASVQQ